MTLSVITGTLSKEFEFSDPWGEFQKLVSQGYFVKQYWTGKQWLPSTKKKVYTFNGKRGQIIQTTGCFKTVLSMMFSYEAHYKGRNTGGNLRIGWTKNNKGKPKSEWKSVMTSMETLQSAQNMHITLDDIRGVIKDWRSDAADMAAETANATRKKMCKMDITTQRMKYVPPDMRDILDEVYVPFCRAFDTTRYAPDGRWYPIELLCLHFSPGLEFMDAKIYNLTRPTEQYVLNNYDTLQIADSLKGSEEGDRQNQRGYELESKAFDFLKDKIPGIKLLNGKQVFDVQCDTHGFDVCAMDESGNLRTEHKHLNMHIKTARRKDLIPYLMFPYKDSWGFIKITNGMAHRHIGDRIDTYHIKIFDINAVLAGITR